MKKINLNDEKFLEKRDKLRVKEKLKKEKKLKKYEKRAKFYKNPFVFIIRWLIRIGLITLIVLSYLMLKQMYIDYNNSNKWTKESGPKLATIPPELLYSNAKDKKIKLEYIDLKNKIWDDIKKNFKPNINNEDINQLSKLYDNMSEPKDFAKESHDMILDLWQVKQQRDRIIHKNTIPENINIMNIEKYINNNKEKISKYLLKDPKNNFAKNIRKEMYLLQSDVFIIENLLQQSTQYYYFNKNSIFVKNNIYPQDFVNYTKDINQLNFKWLFIENKIQSIVNKTKPILIQHTNQLNKFNAYQQDIENKKDFFNFLDEYKNMDKYIKSTTIQLKDFEGQSLKELNEWASKNNINIKVNTIETNDEKEDTILKQYPNKSDYQYIAKNSTIEVDIAIKVKEEPTTEEPTTEEPTVEESTTEESTNEELTTEKSTAERLTIEQPLNEERSSTNIIEN